MGLVDGAECYYNLLDIVNRRLQELKEENENPINEKQIQLLEDILKEHHELYL